LVPQESEREQFFNFYAAEPMVVWSPVMLCPATCIIVEHTQVFPNHLHHISRSLKGKAAPLQAWSGPEGSRNSRFPDFMTTAQDGGKVVSLPHRPPLPPGNTPGTHFC